jgi:hypothetical protein
MQPFSSDIQHVVSGHIAQPMLSVDICTALRAGAEYLLSLLDMSRVAAYACLTFKLLLGDAFGKMQTCSASCRLLARCRYGMQK